MNRYEVDPLSAKDKIGYSELNLGLNNQKLALFGLFNHADNRKLPLVLPSLCNFDVASGKHTIVPLKEVYSLTALDNFANAFSIKIHSESPINNYSGWDCFISGTHRLGMDAIKGMGMLDDFTCQFFSNFIPKAVETKVFRKLYNSVFFESDVSVVCQLRIEKDWSEQANRIKSKPIEFIDEYELTYQKIFSKIKNSLQADLLMKPVYVVCDETNLPISKNDIKVEVMKEFNISLIFKSDILQKEEIDSLSLLEKSIVDFEMAVRAPAFVGLSRSTFANLANFEAFCRSGKLPPAHYIYNSPGPALGRRCDYGARVNPAEVTNELYRRAPLIPDKIEDCLWPASITAHISHFGDFITQSGTIAGTRRGPLVAGIRGDTKRLIQGFSIKFLSQASGNLEYRAKLADGSWTEWMPSGSFAGTRGKNQNLIGFAVRLVGKIALNYECLCVGSFANSNTLIKTHGGQNCCLDNDASLEAMQIVFRPKMIT